jgi:hypothetical protein
MSHRERWGRGAALRALLLLVLLGLLRGDTYDDADFLDDGGDYEGNVHDPAYEQYAERLQQQLESLRKEHDVIFQQHAPCLKADLLF